MVGVIVWWVEYGFLIFLVLCCGLVLCILLLVCVVDDGCHRAFDRLDYTEGDKIVVLQYPLLVLLVSLVLNKNFGSLLVSLDLSHLGALNVLFHRYYVGVVCEGA